MVINIFIITTLGLLGATLGSFMVAQVWRLRFRQLKEDGEKCGISDEKEHKRLQKLSRSVGGRNGKISGLLSDRSRCLECGYQLKWYDLVPVISWLALKGKCRKCAKSIGVTEILAEIIMAALLPLSYIYWPGQFGSVIGVAQFVVWVIFLVPLGILFIYDYKWSLLPVKLLTICIVVAVFYKALDFQALLDVSNIFNLLTAIVLLAGVYFLLYLFSRGALVGSGDYLLAIPLALVLSDWFLALVALFLANVMGCLLVAPALMGGKLSVKSHLPLGPLLIGAFLVVFFSQDIIFMLGKMSLLFL
jgi:prepilin signal peptidase PulO-like enzyme (type II secretory pathway)